MELRQLQYFLVVAKHLHFGRAADALRMSQPPLTVAIKKLEQELGVQLFSRTTRSVELTPAGRAYRERISPLLADLERANHELTEVGLGLRGRIAVGFVSSASYAALPGAIRLFRERRPNVDLALHPLTTNEQIDQLLEGKLDLGILRDPGPVPGLVLTEVHAEPLVVVLQAGHRLAGQAELEIEQLLGEGFVLFPYKHMSGFFALVHSLFDGFAPPRIVERAIHQETILGLVAAGLGVSILPASVARFHMPGVLFRPLAGDPRSALYSATSAANPAAAVFGQCLQEAAGDA
ncbi:LysR substrate-binding domain-containing protein [Glutamicibacter protophormiae]|uniref:LysR substrate-binding domain-containing protein n=1 Tax=Glutamicibacter protophormiae TaxID=37930 RepID=UPI003BB21889